jgi:hypothetical protein
VVLLNVGVALVVVGVVESRSLANRLSNVFMERLTPNTMLYILGGTASAVVGLIVAIGVLGRTRL